MKRKIMVSLVFLICMLIPSAPAQAQVGDNCIAVVIETKEDLGGLLEGMGVSYRRVTSDDLKDEASLARFCVLFVGDGLPPSLDVTATEALGRWVQQGGVLYLSGEARSLLNGAANAQIIFDPTRGPKGELEAEVVDPGLAMVAGARVRLRSEAGWPIMTRAEGQVLLRGLTQVGAGARQAPLVVQLARGRGAVVYSAFVGQGKLSAAEQTLARALALRLIYTRQAGQVVRQRSALPGAAIQITALAQPNSFQTFKHVALANQDFDVVMDDADGQLSLSVVSPLTATAPLSPPAGRPAVVQVRAPAPGEWRIQVRAGQTSTPQPYLLLIIPRAGTNLFNSIPTPLRISTDPFVLGTNGVLAILLTCLLGLGAALFNDRLARAPAAEPARLARVAGAAGRRLASFYNVARSPTTWNVAGLIRRAIVAALLALVFALSALVASMLDRNQSPLTAQGVGVFAGMFIAIGLTNLVFAGGQKMMAGILGEVSALRLRPLGLVGLALLVVISYVVGVLPGFIYAVALGVALLGAAGEATPGYRRNLALLAVVGLLAVLVVGLIFWGLSIPTDLAQRSLDYGAGGGLGAISTTAMGVLQILFLLIFFVALQSVFFELLPVGTLAGGYLFRWSWLMWSILSFVVSFFTLHTLVNPSANLLELTGNLGVLLLAAGLAIYTLAAMGVWLAVHGRGLSGRGAPPSRGATVALALIVGLWIVTCACGVIVTAWGAIAARLGGG